MDACVPIARTAGSSGTQRPDCSSDIIGYFLSVRPGSDPTTVRADSTKLNEPLESEREAFRQSGCLDTGTHLNAADRKKC